MAAGKKVFGVWRGSSETYFTEPQGVGQLPGLGLELDAFQDKALG